MPSVYAIYASTSGHTEYVLDEAVKSFKKAGIDVEKQRAETAQQDDLLKGDILLLASGSWNTGGAEGQMNPYMDELLKKRAANVDLGGKKVLLIGLGDDRYRYTVGCMRYMLDYVQTHNGVAVEPVLKIVNEPYGQEEKVDQWVRDIFASL